jgi:hypothetical protein
LIYTGKKESASQTKPFAEESMLAIKKARKMIEADPKSSTARTFADLILALESESPYQLRSLYDLPGDEFKICLDILQEWRIDRYYAGKKKAVKAAMDLQQDEG